MKPKKIVDKVDPQKETAFKVVSKKTNPLDSLFSKEKKELIDFYRGKYFNFEDLL